MKLREKVNSLSLRLGMLFSAVFLGLLLLISVILYGIVTNIFIDYVTDDLLARGSNHAKALAENYNQITIDHVVTMEKGARTSVLITDTNDNILASSVLPDLEMKNQILKEGKQLIDNVVDKDWQSNKYISTVTKIGSSNGYVYMYYPTNIIKEIVLVLKYLIVITFIGTIFLSFGIIGFLSQKLTSPLLIMKEATNKMAKGEYKQKFSINGSGELAQLGKSIQQLGEQLQAYEDTRNDFLSAVSHELRTPLTYIQGYSDVISKGLYKNSEELIEYTDIINKESRRLSFLLNDLFEMSKLQAGKFELIREPANINVILEKVIANLTPAALEKGIKLVSMLSADCPVITIDEQRMEQVFYNLVENAIKYTDEGEISVRSYLQEKEVVIEVKDSGIGIPQQDIAKIWERFYRVDKSRTRKTGGSGLGLYVVRQIIESHSGKILVNSTEGKGSLFTIYLSDSV